MTMRKAVVLLIRSLLLTSLILALAGVDLPAGSEDRHVVYLLDISASIPERLAANGFSVDQVKELVRRHAALLPANDRSSVILFGRNAARGFESEGLVNRMGTEIAEALEAALALPDDNRRKEIILFSDGNATTGDLESTIARLRGAGVRVYVVPSGPFPARDARIAGVVAPSAIQPGSSFDARVSVASTAPARFNLRLEGSGVVREIASATAGNDERKTILFSSIVPKESAPAHEFKVSLIPPDGDDCPENNVATFTVRSDRRKTSVLYLSDRAESRPLYAILSRNENILLTTDEEKLFHSDVVVLDNKDLASFPRRRLEEIASFVRSSGGGLAILGGDRSFALGGMAKTPIEEVSPVWANPDERVSLLFLLDRSGSMDEKVAGVGKNKLSLAKEAVATLLRSLREGDAIGLISFANVEMPEIDCALTPVTRSDGFLAHLMALEPNGGTAILPALRKGRGELAKATTARRHIILITDGRSAGTVEEFAEQRRRLDEEKTTLSVIAIGGEIDRAKLEALRGKEEDFRHLREVSDLPDALAKALARGKELALTRPEPFPTVTSTPGHPILDGISSFPGIHGLNRTAPKEGATVLLTAAETPLLAIRQNGLGKSAAFTSAVAPGWAEELASWPDSYRFFNQLIAFCARAGGGEEARLEIDREGDDVAIALLTETILEQAPQGSLENLRDGTRTPCHFRQAGVRRFETTLRGLDPGSYLLNIASGGWTTIQPLDIPYPAEFIAVGVNRRVLKAIAEGTGGRLVADPFAIGRAGGEHTIPVNGKPLFIGAALALFLIDLLVATFWK